MWRCLKGIYDRGAEAAFPLFPDNYTALCHELDKLFMVGYALSAAYDLIHRPTEEELQPELALQTLDDPWLDGGYVPIGWSLASPDQLRADELMVSFLKKCKAALAILAARLLVQGNLDAAMRDSTWLEHLPVLHQSLKQAFETVIGRIESLLS